MVLDVPEFGSAAMVGGPGSERKGQWPRPCRVSPICVASGPDFPSDVWGALYSRRCAPAGAPLTVADRGHEAG
jgi:hypothetical protein